LEETGNMRNKTRFSLFVVSHVSTFILLFSLDGSQEL
jgi:hypothetical protein